MSPRLSKASRRALDRYDSPSGLVEPMLARLLVPVQGMTILEPCAGSGVLAKAMQLQGAIVTTGDIDSSLPVNHHWDFPEAVSTGQVGSYDAVITNPPFAGSELFVRAAREVAPLVALLMRITWMEAAKSRRDIWLNDPPQAVWALSPRPDFTGSGGDSATVAWFLWGSPAVIPNRPLWPIIGWNRR